MKQLSGEQKEAVSDLWRRFQETKTGYLKRKVEPKGEGNCSSFHGDCPLQIVNSSMRHMAAQPYAVVKPLKDKLSAVYILQASNVYTLENPFLVCLPVSKYSPLIAR